MAELTPCIYKTITMTAGETFVLPPGAELLGVSDATAVTSSCGDDLPIQTLKCYKLRWVQNTDEEGLTGGVISLGPGIFVPGNIIIPKFNNAWENDDPAGYLQIVKVNIGSEIKDTTGMALEDLAGLEGNISLMSSGSALTDRKYKTATHLTGMSGIEAQYWPNGYDSGYISYELYFKAIEDVAKTVYVEFLGPSDNAGSTMRCFALEIDCVDYPLDSDIPTC